MSEVIWVAIIGAFATIITAILSLYPQLISKSPENNESMGSPSDSKKIVLRLTTIVVIIFVLIIAVDLIYRQYTEGGNRDRFEEMAEKHATNPYIIESATVHVVYVDSAKNDKSFRHAFVRINYVLRLLRDIHMDEDRVFLEEYYDSKTKPSPEHWYGSHSEEFTNDNGSKYAVHIEGKKNELISVVTGANYTYPLPLPNGRITPRGSISMRGPEDYYAYLNETDYIKTLTIVLESPQINLIPHGDLPAFVVQSGKKPTFSKARYGISESPDRITLISQRSISKQWTNIEPDTYNGILYAW